MTDPRVQIPLESDMRHQRRLEQEKAFHNARFAEGDNRETQQKYYWAVSPGAALFRKTVAQFARGARVLEYGCGNSNSEEFGALADALVGIDISEAAIASATAANRLDHVSYRVMDAMNMDFADNSFDLVYGAGIVHHLDTARSAQEISRVLRPGGRAIFWEPLGLNPAINLYRSWTPDARTEDEHPLLPKDIRILEDAFGAVKVQFFGLTTLGAVPMRSTRLGPGLLKALAGIDDALLRLPGLRYLAWYALITCEKQAPADAQRRLRS